MKRKKTTKKSIRTRPVSSLTKEELQAEYDRTAKASKKHLEILNNLYSKHAKTPKQIKKLKDRILYHSRRQSITAQRNNKTYARLAAMRNWDEW